MTEAAWWSLASVLAKAAGLLASAGLVGGSYTLMLAARSGVVAAHTSVLRYLLLSTMLGLAATVSFFLLQVGAFSESGPAGMFDPVMSAILWNSKPGTVTALRSGVFVFTFILVLWMQNRQRHTGVTLAPLACTAMLPALAVLFFSFTLTGHVNTLAAWQQLLLTIHVCSVFLWVGSLYPLLLLSADADRQKVRLLMELFGKTAVAIVLALLLTGIVLLAALLGSPLELVSSAYGRALLLKLLLVIMLLGLGALNKLRLVPGLQKDTGLAALQRSIRLEMGLALLVLAVTAVLTSLLGPATHMTA